MSLDELLLDPHTRQQLEDFLSRPTHALILAAPTGSGKGTLAHHLTAQLLQTSSEQLASHPYFIRLEPDEKGTITIDAIRRAQRAAYLKTVGESSSPIRRAIIIEQAHTLNHEAQNALLKLLEEPPADTIVVLTTESLGSLLPTIVSRAQHIAVTAPTLSATQSFLGDKFESAAVERAYRLSEGSAGLLLAILAEEAEHPLVQALEIVKVWLGESPFERLAQIDELTRSKADINTLLLALMRTAQAALTQAAARGQHQLLNRWQSILQATAEAQNARAHNAQPKLLLTNLMLKL